jgi:hypothetical protein
MNERKHDDGSKKVKNIAAVLYLLAMVVLVGGSYLNQHRDDGVRQNSTGPANSDNKN